MRNHSIEILSIVRKDFSVVPTSSWLVSFSCFVPELYPDQSRMAPFISLPLIALSIATIHWSLQAEDDD